MVAAGVGVMIVVVVGMVEEMEERKVEELVVEMEGRVAGQEDTMASVYGLLLAAICYCGSVFEGG